MTASCVGVFDLFTIVLFVVALSDGRVLDDAVYCSTGDGFIVRDGDAETGPSEAPIVPFPFETAAELLGLCGREDTGVARLMLENEKWGDGTQRVSLDTVIETVRQTGRDMSVKYKETALGGHPVNVVEC